MKRRTLLLSALAAAPALRAQTPPPGVAMSERPLPAVGSALPLAGLPELPLLGPAHEGRRFAAAQAEGRVLVLYWWASWCPFCAVQSPEMDKLWRAQAPRGLLLLGLSIDRKPDDAVAYLQRRGYAFPSAWVSPAVERALPRPKGLPVTVVRGRDGRVLMAESGQLFPEDVEGIGRFLG